MKKVTRLRLGAEETSNMGHAEQAGVRTTGRIKKPKAVFDPSDNYLPRSYRTSVGPTAPPQVAAYASAQTAVASDRKREPENNQTKRPASQVSGPSPCSTASFPLNTPPMDACYVCHKRETKRGLGAKNKLITCIDCESKVHKMCLKLDFENYDALRSNFKCENCRSCTVCSNFSDADAEVDVELITCTKCVKSYHLTCHIPSVLNYQSQATNWKCNKCISPINGNGKDLAKEAIREIIGDDSASCPNISEKSSIVNVATAAEEVKKTSNKRSVQTTKTAQNAITNGNDSEGNIVNKKSKVEDNLLPVRYNFNEPFEIPDVKFWSVEQVTEFFTKYFPKEAYVFKDHEIDGMSLLLLKRSDVIKKLPIKLGPSLRIYSLILKIQTQLNDSTLGWN